MAEVYRQHVPHLTRLLRASAFRTPLFAPLRAPAELENVLLEVFARALEPRTRAIYDGQRPFEVFLMGIARNVLLEQLRNREDAAGDELGAVVDEAMTQEPTDVHSLFEDREVSALLAAFRKGLQGDEAKLYELRFVDALTQDQAAAKLGQTRIQVRRREQKLRASLLEWLKSNGYLTHLTAQGWSFVKGTA